MAQSGRNMVFDPARPISERRLIHRRRAIAGAHRCLHRGIQRDRRAIRLDQEEGLPAAVQKPLYHPTLIPGTSSKLVLGDVMQRFFWMVSPTDWGMSFSAS